jgi:hypothetical protein
MGRNQSVATTDLQMAPLDLARLDRAVRAAEPAAVLVPAGLLRRVIKQDRQIPQIGLRVPHRKSYLIGRDALLRIADRAELELGPGRELPETVILLVRPEALRLAALPAAEVLFKYWRLLFHAAVHRALDRRAADGKLPEAALQERARHIGRAEFDEVRTVLRRENFLLPPGDLLSVYTEFAAVYLEMRSFVPALLPVYFPGIDCPERIDKVLAEDVDAAALFAATRLDGAPDPAKPVSIEDEEAEAEAVPDDDAPLPAVPSERLFRRLVTRAKRVGKLGNVVRAAILRARAARVAGPGVADTTGIGARNELERLVRRLQAALGVDDAAARAWRQALPWLLEPAARGTWTAEGRLLYDLQKVCIDHEREIYSVDVVEWVLALGRRPFKRPLPYHREVLMTRHLRSAARRLTAARVSDPQRRALARLLGAAVHQSEHHLRERFRPVIEAALAEVGMVPHNFPERAARHKVVEELLDRVVERGFFNMGDLRDTLSRNNLKLPDLAGPVEFLRGDRLLRTNRRFAVALDGVYRRGEIYLRWLQRFSSVAFGTRAGRFLTRFVILPFGGAFIALEGLQHLIDPVTEYLADTKVHLVSPASVAGLGVFALALLHVPPFRKAVAAALGLAWRGVRGLLFDLPVYVLGLPPVRRLLASRPFRLFRDYLLRPLIAAGVAVPLLRLCHLDWPASLAAGAAVFAAACLFLNLRLARRVEEAVVDWVVLRSQQLLGDILPGLFRFIVYLFKRLLEDVERFLYAVDEWFRFRKGDRWLSLAVKPVLGLVWFVAAYVIRIYVNLLIEPTVNPIKHFPVVTVAAKIILPFSLKLTRFLAASLVFLGPVWSKPVAVSTVFFLPGVFGFLVWELKENWRLYQANRPRTLRPVVLGHHGETLVRFLRPGFHSGTLPKLYAKLRRAERRAQRTGNRKASRRHREAVRQVEEALRHFAERELLFLLNESTGWGRARVTAGEIATATNRVRVQLCCPGLAADDVQVTFAERGGWLVAGVARRGWLRQLSPGQTAVLQTALAGFYKLAGVDLIREQVEANLEAPPAAFDVTEDGLVVWPGANYETAAVYDPREEPAIHPRVLAGPAVWLPVLDARRLLFAKVPIAWPDWVETWERSQAGGVMAAPLPDAVRLLPAAEGERLVSPPVPGGKSTGGTP